MKEYTVGVDVEVGGYTLKTSETVDAYSEEEAKTDAETKVFDNLLVVATNVEPENEEDDCSEFTVTVSVEHGGYAQETTETVDSYSEDQAKEDAIEKVKDNIITNATSAECEDEDDED